MKIEAKAQNVAQVSLDTEVRAQTARRKLTASYKIRILNRIDQTKNRGEIGQILRAEGLYSSQVSKWRKARDSGTLHGLSSQSYQKRSKDSSSIQVKKLLKDKARLEKKLAEANAIIDIQKKVFQLFKEMSQQDENGTD